MVQTLIGPDIQVSLMPEDVYVKLWPQIEAELDKVPHIWQDYYTKEYLRDVPLHQELMTWCVVEKGAVMIVIYAHFIEIPRGKGISFKIAIGQGLNRALPQLEATFERLGQVMGCDFVQVCGRRGWTRKLNGFKEDYVVSSRWLQKFEVQ